MKPRSHPNFPEYLDIKPSTCSTLSRKTDDPDVFGIAAQSQAIEKYGIAGRVWEAAHSLNLYINPPHNVEFDPPFPDPSLSMPRLPMTIIELGSGTGIVGYHTSQVLNTAEDLLVITDLPEVCPLLEHNLHSVLQDTVLVRPLAWGNAEHVKRIHADITNHHHSILTHIVCSDLVYFSELLSPLLRTLIQLSSPPFVTLKPLPPARLPTIIISYKVRSLSKEAPFWSAFGLWFSFQPVCLKTKDRPYWHHSGSFDDSPFIFVARRREDSYHWNVPESDDDLLAGVGARGSNSRKSDDTFESLLLLSITDGDE